eukprot:15460214-Alexandrium_andersonii.AAC.1
MSSRGGSAHPEPPEKRLRRARRPVSSADSAPARETAQNAPLWSFGGPLRELRGPNLMPFLG